MGLERRPELPPRPDVLIVNRNTEVQVSPNGALVTRFTVQGINVLMPDQYYIENQKRRGGAPLLIPNAGPHPEDGGMKLEQHGFGRNLPWEVVNYEPGSDQATFILKANNETLAQFPYDFDILTTISVRETTPGGSLRYGITTTNLSELTMPFAPGVHPYFDIEPDQKGNIETNLPDFDPTDHPWGDAQIYDMPEDGVEILIPNKGIVIVTASKHFKKMVVWDEDGKSHVCFEPWVGGLNAILDSDERINIDPLGTEMMWVEIEFFPITEA
jgi:galactose mutarotase-like enzyme